MHQDAAQPSIIQNVDYTVIDSLVIDYPVM